jgi:hypothetical protein
VHKYYKFNLQHGSFFTWLRLEQNPLYWERGWKAFRILRQALGHHQNAHFNMCEIALSPAALMERGGETREELRLWLQRSRRSTTFDLSGTVATTVYSPPVTLSLPGADDPPGPVTIAAHPVPANLRPYTDFLWQRSPFQLQSGGNGTHESPGVDYILPYWMGRYYGVFE